MNRVLMFWLATLLVFAGSLLVWTLAKNRGPIAPGGAVQVPDKDAAAAPPKLQEFELLDQTGKRVSSHDFDGQIWAGSFFFASCPSTCYNQNIKLQQLHAKYAERGLRLVSITCDPGKDTPVALAGYASRFNADPATWKFLTPADGDMQYIQRIANDYFQVAVGPETHTDRVMLFDREGKQLGAYSVLNAPQFRELDERIDQALGAGAAEAAQPSQDKAADESEAVTATPDPSAS
jgi:protein SCO1